MTIIIAPWHNGGDQIIYIAVYTQVSNRNFWDALIHYQGAIAAIDIIHFIYIYIFSNMGLSKNIAMGIANAYLFYLSAKLLYSYK